MSVIAQSCAAQQCYSLSLILSVFNSEFAIPDDKNRQVILLLNSSSIANVLLDKTLPLTLSTYSILHVNAYLHVIKSNHNMSYIVFDLIKTSDKKICLLKGLNYNRL